MFEPTYNPFADLDSQPLVEKLYFPADGEHFAGLVVRYVLTDLIQTLKISQ